MADVIGVGHLDRMLDHVVLDLGENIPDQLGLAWYVGAVEYAGELFNGNGGMDAPLFFEEIVYHVQKMDAELDESVRRIRHNEELFHETRCRLDFLARCMRPKF